MAHQRHLKHISFVMLLLLAGCTTPAATPQITASPTKEPTPSFTPVPSSTPLASVTPSTQPTFTSIPTETPTLVPHFLRSVDVMAYANTQDGQWFGSELYREFTRCNPKSIDNLYHSRLDSCQPPQWANLANPRVTVYFFTV